MMKELPKGGGTQKTISKQQLEILKKSARDRLNQSLKELSH